jgi:glycosyltransferase involved in cell wall biosynthesis
MNHPSVSVVIPTYNGADYLCQTIESVLNQSIRDFEIIINDDASQDRTVSISERYMKNYSNISFFNGNERAGIGANWNKGIRRARGRYIKVLAQDDLLKRDCLEESIKIFEKHDSVSLITSYRELIGEKNENRTEKYFPSVREIDGSKVQKDILKNGNWIGGPTAVFFKQEDISKVGLFDEQLSCGLDWEMWLRLLGLGNLYVHPKILFSTRIHSAQETSNCIRNLGFLKDRITVFNKIQNEPNLYGFNNLEISKSDYRQAVLQLIKNAKKKKPSQISDVRLFLNRYQSIYSTWSFQILGLLQNSVQLIRSKINLRG